MFTIRNSFSFVLLLLLIFGSCEHNSNKVDDTEPVEQETLMIEQTLFQGQQFDKNRILDTIALGSCSRQDMEQVMWPAVIANKPDIWIWLGDNIYGDTEDMELMEAKYLEQKNNSDYQTLRAQCPIVGIWDDHDFGVNDGGKAFSKKEESRDLLFDFLDVPKEDSARNRKGAYQAYTMGQPGKLVKVILLDARYFRDDLLNSKTSGRRYDPNPQGDILGEAQWQWLESELTNSTAQVHLIGSGIQIIPEEHGFEKWGNLPQARSRLLELIRKTNPAHTIFMSGDRHIAEISKLELEGLSSPVYEITSSGLTHAYEAVGNEPNKFRVSELIGKKNFGLVLINWESPEPKIALEVRGENNVVFTHLDLN